MSYSFKAGDEIVWDPALRVGKLFLGQVEAVAAVLDLPSGLTARIDGTCDVDPGVYAAFFAEFRAWHFKSRHAEFLLLTEGLVTVALTVLLRTGQQPPAGSGDAWEAMLADARLRAKNWA